MKKYAAYFLVLIFLLSLNMVFPQIKGSAPNFLFLFIIFLALEKEDDSFLWLAFFAGLILDFTSSLFFGTFTLSFLTTALVINYTTRAFLSLSTSFKFTVGIIA